MKLQFGDARRTAHKVSFAFWNNKLRKPKDIFYVHRSLEKKKETSLETDERPREERTEKTPIARELLTMSKVKDCPTCINGFASY